MLQRRPKITAVKSPPPSPPPSRTILYARVSTADQTLDHQVTQAQAAGFAIDEVVADHGVSGIATTLTDLKGRRLADKLRAGDTLVVRWVDRLGRNYADVTDTIRDFMRGASSSRPSSTP